VPTNRRVRDVAAVRRESIALPIMNTVEPKPVDLVLEGGGVKGLALTSAVSTLVRAGYAVRRVAGTFAGAIVGAILAAMAKSGEPIDRLDDLSRTLDFTRLLDRGPIGSALARAGLAPLATAAAVAFRSGINR